jgi:hypothetical protein
MIVIVRVCAVAGVLLTAGCASWTPNLDFLPSLPSLSSGGPTVTLGIETDPPGADARTSVGPGCRTPCTVAVPADREFTVSLTLNGYLPQTVPVRPRVPDNVRPEPEGSVIATADLVPNPILVQMDPAPPPAPPPKKRRAPRSAKAKAPKQ